MSVNMLRSHSSPDLFLHEHINQVFTAMQGIFSWHSESLITSEIREICQKLSCCHDLGKGSSAFQEYIADPERFLEENDPLDKSHTPLSFFLTISKAEQEKRDSLETLLLCACIYGHHGGLPLLPPRCGQSGKQKTLDQFAAGRMYKILCTQIENTDYAALEKETDVPLTGLSSDKKMFLKISRFLKNHLFSSLRKLSVDDAVIFRLKTQLSFSILLEADKAFLAVKNSDLYLKRDPRFWQSQWIDLFIGNPEDTEVNRLRQKAKKAVQESIANNRQDFIQSLTAPTGLGKTLLAADWALRNRELSIAEVHYPPKIIVVMPFLSIIDQTSGVYKKLLEFGTDKPDGSWFLTSHSLSDREYSPEMEDNEAGFFIDTWRTELIITTYDQFLMSLVDPKARYQMRFHNLCDSLIIMDEVQSLPCHMWQLLNTVFKYLADTCNTKILLMSATLPPFVKDARPLLENYKDYFIFRRYKFIFKHGGSQNINDFCEKIGKRLINWLEIGERVLITLNTRKSAGMVFDYLQKLWPEEYQDIKAFFISADVTPKDRLKKIEEIKKGRPCIVVSTQCIEAGVDIDMSLIIRDFAPWDSLVQIAGRCNREGERGEFLTVEIADLSDDKGKRYSEMIYDIIHLNVTRHIIGDRDTISEHETLAFSEEYFDRLNSAKDTGKKHLERFAYWEEDVSIHELLRGDKMQHTFLVIEQDRELLNKMKQIKDIEDRWKRRDAWRKLAGRIASISVSIFARYGFKPEEIASNQMGQWILHDGYYDSESGLKIDSIYADKNNVSIIF
ncbi:Putative CRISPR-associated helicase Cas3 [Desulfonema limicola]|uniref:CRISPR-associated helicase Cas3 n=1 Tax=Desulfonema limicola TaxID=45656 RepID=A0A975GH07_9BACT|nr:CRISPR-associated helicase Cas3' [Desulfonema limicola]QTA80758.1 Putative CRISPR-associated helicase Cas3 [Desulfonema limicola]